MKTFLSFADRTWSFIVEWSGRCFAIFMSWLTSARIEQFAANNRIKGYFYILLSPVLMFIPVFSLLSAFEMFSYHFWAGFFSLIFTLFTIFTFIGIPLLLLYANFRRYSYWKVVQISSAVLMLVFALLWGIKFYHSFLPAITNKV